MPPAMASLHRIPTSSSFAVEYGLGRVRQGIADLLLETASGQLGAWKDRRPDEVIAIWKDVWNQLGRPLLVQKLTQAGQNCIEILRTYESSHPVMQARRISPREPSRVEPERRPG